MNSFLNQIPLKIVKWNAINFLYIFFITTLIIEIFFGHWFASHSFGPYMREHRLKKNPVVLSYNGTEYNYIYKRNYYGFRGEEMDPSKIEAVIIGGSTTDERYKPQEMTITNNLNTLLKKNGYNFQIINAGIEGQSTVGHIYNFEHWFPKLENFSPKLYIFYIGANDFGFEADQDEYFMKLGDGHIKNPNPVEVFFDYLKSNSFFYDKLRIIKHKYYLTDKKVSYDHKFHDSIKIQEYEYINYKKALKLHDIKKLKIKHKIVIAKFLKRIKILNTLVNEEDSTAVFINQVLFDGLKHEKLFILNHSLIEYCKSKNIYCIDLAIKLDGKFSYWYDEVHTTPLGSKIIAETVIDDLITIIKQEKLF